MAKKTSKKGDSWRRGENRSGSGDAPSFREMTHVSDKPHKRRGGGFWKCFLWYGMCAAAFLIAVRFLWIGVQTGFKSSRAEIVCNVCGAAIRQGVTVDLASFDLNPPWETAIQAAGQAATAAILQRDAPSPTPTPEDKNIHYALCGDCAKKVENFLKNG